jgi:predicted aspartyl protease
MAIAWVLVIAGVFCLFGEPQSRSINCSGNEVATCRQVVHLWSAALSGSGLQRADSIYERYKLSSDGLEGEISRWVTGTQYHESTDIPNVFREDDVLTGSGFGWVRDITGVPHPASARKRREIISDFTWNSMVLLKPDEETLPSAIVRDNGSIEMIFSPPGGEHYTVTLDSRTFLPTRRDVYRGAQVQKSEIFSDWQEHSGIKLAGEVRLLPRDDSEVDLTLREAKINPEIPLQIFQPPPDDAPTLTFTSASHEIPFELWGVHPLIHTRVNASSLPLSLLLDTGGDFSFLSKERAEEVGLRSRASISTSGAGGSEASGLIPDVTFSFDGIKVGARAIGLISGSGISRTWGRRFDGVLGYDVISRFVIRIDYTTQSMTFYDPSVFHYRGGGAVLPISYAGNNVTIPAQLSLSPRNSIQAQLIVDTGSSAGITLRSPFVRANHLTEYVKKTVEASSSGVGAATGERIGRIIALKLGRFVVRRPIAEFSLATKGTEAGDEVPGALGGEILSRFTVYLDYPHGCIIIEPNARFSDPFEFDMTGLEVAATDDLNAIVVKGVRSGSAGSQIGIKPGDVLIAVNGESFKPARLPELRAMFRKPGQMKLSFLRQGKRHDATLLRRRDL